MNNSEIDYKFEKEISKALEARAKGNEGMARVCARRGVGIILSDLYSHLSISYPHKSSHEQIKLLLSLPIISDEIKEIVSHFLIHVDHDHKFPLDVDLISEAIYLKQALLNKMEYKMDNENYSLFNLFEQIEEIPIDSTISRTIFNDNQIKVVLFGFYPGQELSEHTASMPAIIHILAGESTITLKDDTISAQQGTWIQLPANYPHSIVAKTKSIMLLTLQKTNS